MADKTKIVAIGLLTAHDLEQLGAGFARAYPVDSAPCFGELLLQIDAADRDAWQTRDRQHSIVTGNGHSPRRR